jgi:hypothetical protein
MVSLYAIITFIVITILTYTVIAVCVSARAQILRWRLDRNGGVGANVKDRIERETDALKEQAFKASIALSFFAITPFAIIMWLFNN